MASAFRLYSEYIGARFAMALIRVLPPRMLFSVAEAVGSLAYACSPKRRHVAIDNIVKAGIAPAGREARRIAKASFKSIALTVAESMVVPELAEKHPEMVSFEIVAPEETRKILEDPSTGVIIVSGHLGNWELGAKVTSRFKRVAGVARKMNNPRVQKLMESVKFRDGFETIDKHDSKPMKVVRALRDHKALSLLTDQHAHGDSACMIDFFGMPASTYTTPAVLYHIAKAPLIMCFVTRLGRLSFRIEYTAPFDFQIAKATFDADVVAATQCLALRLEEEIRKRPEQYLWAHRRWRTPSKAQG